MYSIRMTIVLAKFTVSAAHVRLQATLKMNAYPDAAAYVEK